MSINRRDFLASLPAAAGLAKAASQSRYRVGITTNTRGGWEKDVFLSFREAHEAGFQYVESFINYFMSYLDNPDGLRKKIGSFIGSFRSRRCFAPPRFSGVTSFRWNSMMRDA